MCEYLPICTGNEDFEKDEILTSFWANNRFAIAVFKLLLDVLRIYNDIWNILKEWYFVEKRRNRFQNHAGASGFLIMKQKKSSPEVDFKFWHPGLTLVPYLKPTTDFCRQLRHMNMKMTQNLLPPPYPLIFGFPTHWNFRLELTTEIRFSPPPPHAQNKKASPKFRFFAPPSPPPYSCSSEILKTSFFFSFLMLLQWKSC